MEKQYIYFLIASVSFVLNALLIFYFFKSNPIKNAYRSNTTQQFSNDLKGSKAYSKSSRIDMELVRDIIVDPNDNIKTSAVLNNFIVNSGSVSTSLLNIGDVNTSEVKTSEVKISAVNTSVANTSTGNKSTRNIADTEILVSDRDNYITKTSVKKNS